jgi:hypothetical protein
MRFLLVVLLALPLAGCLISTYAEDRAALAAKDDAECRSYGAQPGSQAYVQCRATRASAHEMAEAVPAPAPAPVKIYGDRPPPLAPAPVPRQCFVSGRFVNCY